MAMLEVKNLSISFGGLRAVDSFDLKIEKGMLYDWSKRCSKNDSI